MIINFGYGADQRNQGSLGAPFVVYQDPGVLEAGEGPEYSSRRRKERYIVALVE